MFGRDAVEPSESGFYLSNSSRSSRNCARVSSRGRCTTTASAVILFTLLRTKVVKLSRKSSGRLAAP